MQEIAILQMMLSKQERLSAKYKKRWQRSRHEVQVAPLGQCNTPFSLLLNFTATTEKGGHRSDMDLSTQITCIKLRRMRTCEI